jgi:Icc-related predicted phosphoesterase
MKFLHVTDIEGFIPVIPAELVDKISFMVISGDITLGTKVLERNAKTFKKIRDAVPNKIPIYYIPGNREYENIADTFEGIPPNLIPLHKKIIKIQINETKNLFLVGLGGALPGLNDNYVNTEDQFKQYSDMLFSKLQSEFKPDHDKDIVVFVVHNPPFSEKLDKTMRNEHIGSHAIRNAVEKYKPQLLVCGHVHESQGMEKIADTLCINPGASKFGTATLISLVPTIDAQIIKITAERFASPKES